MKPDAEQNPRNHRNVPLRCQSITVILGMFNFMQPYIPPLSHHTAPLRKFLHKKLVFYWDDNTNTTFQKLKTPISKAHSTPMQYYQRDLPITIQADTSKHGLDACLLQHCKPIAFTLKSLTDFETRDSYFEWDLLAIGYECEQFHTYLYSHPFTVETGHKSLEMIALK